jgi:hypothetical protein
MFAVAAVWHNDPNACCAVCETVGLVAFGGYDVNRLVPSVFGKFVFAHAVNCGSSKDTLAFPVELDSRNGSIAKKKNA